MAAAAIDEAVRNIVAVGGRFDRIAILDNFCWGNCDKPDRLGALARAARGCYDAALAFAAPFISGKDSLNNEFQTDAGETINIPGTLLISALGLVDDVNRCVSMDAKRPGNLLVVVGLTKNELGASHYYQRAGALGAHVPEVDLKTAPKVMAAVAEAIKGGLVAACHDCSEGGLAVALAEMALAGGLGLEIDLAGVPADGSVSRTDQLLFSESPSRFVLEVVPENFSKLASVLREVRFGQIGQVSDSGRLMVRDAQRRTVIDAGVAELKETWQAPLRW
jgi:phosphoribosylformylglycinamidine synthase